MLAVEYVEPASLKPAPYNPRTIDRAALHRLAGLLDVHGFVDPVIARRDDRLVIGGHQRLKANALRVRPDQRVPCVFLDGLDDARAKALTIAVNNAEAQGRFDPPQLARLLAELDESDLSVPDVTGFAPSWIGGLDGPPAGADDALGDVEIPECYAIIIECDSPARQQELFERFSAEGLRCRLSML